MIRYNGCLYPVVLFGLKECHRKGGRIEPARLSENLIEVHDGTVKKIFHLNLLANNSSCSF